MDSKQAAVALCDRACAHMPASVDLILPMYIKGACAGCIALALDTFARKRDQEIERLKMRLEIAIRNFHGVLDERDAAREREAAVWEEAYEEFNYLVRSRSLWTPQFGEVLKKVHEARAGEERGTP